LALSKIVWVISQKVYNIKSNTESQEER